MAVQSILEGGKNSTGPSAPMATSNHRSQPGDGFGYDTMTVLNITTNMTPNTTTVLVPSDPIQWPSTLSKRRVQVGHRLAMVNQRRKM